MAMKDWFSRRSRLQLALERGTKPGADLQSELFKLGDYEIASKADAEAVCDLLKRLADGRETIGGDSATRAVVRLFQDVKGRDCPAFAVMEARGLPVLNRLAKRAVDDHEAGDKDAVLLALKMLVMYGTKDGSVTVVLAALSGLHAESWLWSVILGGYAEGHPGRDWVYEQLSDPLPDGFIAVSLLDSANQAHREGREDKHPFDSDEGVERLEQWLIDPDEEHFSYAVSAAAALSFLSHPRRDSLLALAFDHASADVAMEAAFGAARLGREAGVAWLSRMALDVNHSAKARRYLEELERGDAVPAECDSADFQARAEFAEWLAHPNELGHPPDSVEVVDTRELAWPPERQKRPFWLLRYRVRDRTGLADDDEDVGLVGGMTFCLFSYKVDERPPEEAYGIHACWEMSNRELITEINVPESSDEYDGLIAQYGLGDVTDARVSMVAGMSPSLKYPQKIVALAAGKRNGEAGFLVLDGPRSRWYPASELPAGVFARTVLMAHVGRELLGFGGDLDRRKFLKPPAEKRPAAQTIAAYEKLVDEARANPKRAVALLGNHTPLGAAFPTYVEALAETRGLSTDEATRQAYENFLAIATTLEGESLEKASSSFGTLGRQFEAYTKALLALDRGDHIRPLIERFRPLWDHNMGRGMLGDAAFRAGLDDLAEPFYLALNEQLAQWWRSDHVENLAELWIRQGREDEAHRLVIDSLKRLIAEGLESSNDSLPSVEKWFRERREAYLRIFPDRGEAELERQEISASPFSS